MPNSFRNITTNMQQFVRTNTKKTILGISIVGIMLSGVATFTLLNTLPNKLSNAAPVYTCPAGQTLVGSNCESYKCTDNSNPDINGNCSINQMGLFVCNGTGTKVMPWVAAAPQYTAGLCTNRPDLFVQGSCSNDLLGYGEDPYLNSPVGTTKTINLWLGPGSIGLIYNKIFANGQIKSSTQSNFGDDYESVVNNFRDNNLQNNMCFSGKQITNGVSSDENVGDYFAVIEKLNNTRACPAGFGVLMIPSGQKHYIVHGGNNQNSSSVPILCANYSVNTTALKSIAYGTPGASYRPKDCASVNSTEIFGVDQTGGDAEASTLCGPSSPQPASVIGQKVVTPASQSSNAPDGSLDGISSTGIASGWVTDADVPNTPLDVHFYVDGTNTSIGTYVGKTTASFVRPDLASPYNTGNNGYNFAIPDQYCDSQNHTLSAYGIDAPTYVSNTLLTGSPKTFNIAPAQCKNVVNPGSNGISNVNTSNNCTTSDVNLVDQTTNNGANDKLRCIFPLTGTRTNFTLPVDGIKASINGATGVSDPCFVDNNYQQVLYRKVKPDQTVGKSLVIPYSAYGTNKDNFDNYGGPTAGTGNGAGNLPMKTGWINDTAADMNGDGKPDLVWRNYDTTGVDAGKVVFWFMDKDKILSTMTLTTKVIDPNWHIVGAGDFDGDGKADLAWANYATKTIYIWYLSGGNTTDLVSNGAVKFNANDTNTAIIPDGWRIQAVGDMDGNGKVELIFRQITGAGALSYWSTSSTPVNATTRNVYLDTVNTVNTPASNNLADQSFHIYATGDLNGDGKTDLVFANLAPVANASTKVYVWNMNNSIRLSDKVMETFGGNLAPWKISGLGDMDNDGKLDIIYKYYGPGQSYLVCGNIPAANAPAGTQNVSLIKGVEAPITKGSTIVTTSTCTNNATNPPTCNVCPTGFYFNTPDCLYLQKVGIDYKEFTAGSTNPTTGVVTPGTWNSQYKTNNGTSYNTFKCDDIKALTDPTHLVFDTKNYLGVKEVCNKTRLDAIASGIANPRIFFYGFIYKQVNTRTNVTKYYSFVYTSYFDANGNFVNWYSQLKKDNPSSTGYIIYDSVFNKIG